MDFLLSHWEYFLLGFMLLEKIVKLTPFKWDDILIDGLKAVFIQFGKMKGKPVGHLLLALFSVLAFTSCAATLEQYQESSTQARQAAQITAKDWLFGSGIIRGALPSDALPSWVEEELSKVDAWCESGEELGDYQLGYSVGLRLRLAGPVARAAINQYAPGILGIPEVAMVLSFIGL